MRDDTRQVENDSMFTTTAEQRVAVNSFRRYAEKRLRPLGDHYEKLGTPPTGVETIALFRELESFRLIGSMVCAVDGRSGIGDVGIALLFVDAVLNLLESGFM